MRLYGTLTAVEKSKKSVISVIGDASRRFGSSTFLLVVAAFVIGYVSLFFGMKNCTDRSDVATLELPGWMLQFTQTLPKYLGSTNKPDVLLMGSSLVLSPAALIEKQQNRTGFACTYFENRLKERTGKAIRVDNVGVIAGMVCDQYAILKASLEADKKPDFIIYGMAPRDLADNLTSAENSPTQQVLAFCQSTNKFLPESLKPEDIELCWNAHKLGANRWLKTVRSAALHLACDITKHPATLSEAVPQKVEQQAPVHTRQVVIAEDLEIYRQRYNPPNFDRLKSQSAYLDRLLSLCAEQKTPILLVNMPLPDVNRNVIPPQLLAAYKETVKRIADKYGVEVWDLDGNAVFAENSTNFNDCVHLNANGGKKFFNMLADYLVKDKPFDTAYGIQSSSVAESGKAAVF